MKKKDLRENPELISLHRSGAFNRILAFVYSECVRWAQLLFGSFCMHGAGRGGCRAALQTLMCSGQAALGSVCQPVKPLCAAARTELSGGSLCYSAVMVTD